MEVQIYWEAKKKDGSHLCLCPWRETSILVLPFLVFWEHHFHHGKYRTQGYLTVPQSSWCRKLSALSEGTLSYLLQLPYYAIVVLTQETLCLSDGMLPHQILFTLAHISPRGAVVKLTLSVLSGPSQKAPALSGQCLLSVLPPWLPRIPSGLNPLPPGPP